MPNLIIRTVLVEIIRQYIEYIAHITSFCASKQTGCLSFSEVVWLVCTKTVCASAVHSTFGFHVANVGTVAPRAEWRLYFRLSNAPRQRKSIHAPPSMILSAFCKNSVGALSKPSFYFLLRPAFVIGVVILVPAPTGFHVRGLALAGNIVACSMTFDSRPYRRRTDDQAELRSAVRGGTKSEGTGRYPADSSPLGVVRRVTPAKTGVTP